MEIGSNLQRMHHLFDALVLEGACKRILQVFPVLKKGSSHHTSDLFHGELCETLFS